MNRKNKKGGVALYIHNGFKYKVAENMSTCIDDVIEWISVDIYKEKQKNVTVSRV